MTQDKRKLLRSTPPDGRWRVVQVYLSADLYEKLYNLAFDAERSLADQVRTMINDHPQVP